MSKDDMRKKNISSPDVADTLAQLFLINMISDTSEDDLNNKNDLEDFEIIDLEELEELQVEDNKSNFDITTISIDDL